MQEVVLEFLCGKHSVLWDEDDRVGWADAAIDGKKNSDPSRLSQSSFMCRCAIGACDRDSLRIIKESGGTGGVPSCFGEKHWAFFKKRFNGADFGLLLPPLRLLEGASVPKGSSAWFRMCDGEACLPQGQFFLPNDLN